MLDEFGEDVTVIAIDRDPDALGNAKGMGLTAVEGNFGELAEVVAPMTDRPISAVLFDLGVSSHQLDEAKRGFSYRHDGPLDMRMGPDAARTAADIVNEWSEADLTGIIRRFGEEPMASRIARAALLFGSSAGFVWLR